MTFATSVSRVVTVMVVIIMTMIVIVTIAFVIAAVPSIVPPIVNYATGCDDDRKQRHQQHSACEHCVSLTRLVMAS